MLENTEVFSWPSELKPQGLQMHEVFQDLIEIYQSPPDISCLVLHILRFSWDRGQLRSSYLRKLTFEKNCLSLLEGREK